MSLVKRSHSSDPPDRAGAVLAKPDSPLRWLSLFLNCVVMIGVYYAFDVPAALKTQVGLTFLQRITRAT